MDRHSTTVTKVAEGCVYIRRPFYAISLMRGELQHSALCSFSPLCPIIQRRKEHSSDREAVRASRLGLYEQPLPPRPPPPGRLKIPTMDGAAAAIACRSEALCICPSHAISA